MHQDVQKYFDAVPEDRRPLFNKLHELILSLYPKADVLIWFGMPTYRAKCGWVAIANQRNFVSLYTNSPDHISEFKEKYPSIRTNKASINIRESEEFPEAGLKKVVRHAMEC
jgi:hypothetical protein